MTDSRFAKQSDDLKDRARRDPAEAVGGDSRTDAPEVATPAVDAPDVDAPDVAVPDVDAPDVDAPEVAVPDAAVPEAASSAVEAPDRDIPGQTPQPVLSGPNDPGAAGTSGIPETPGTSDDDGAPLLGDADAVEKLRTRWQRVQVGFVDDPRHSVEEADSLVEQVVAQFTEAVNAALGTLRDDWQASGPGSAADDSGSSTEQLRGSLRAYRRMLNRLLEV